MSSFNFKPDDFDMDSHDFDFDTLKADSRSDDLIIFKCFTVIFSLKKKIIQFPLSFHLYFQQKNNPKVVNLPLTDETLCLSL